MACVGPADFFEPNCGGLDKQRERITTGLTRSPEKQNGMKPAARGQGMHSGMHVMIPGQFGSDDDDVIVISWVYECCNCTVVWVALGSRTDRTDRPSRVVWGEAQASATPPSGGISNSWGNSLLVRRSKNRQRKGATVAGLGPRAWQNHYRSVWNRHTLNAC